MRLLRMRVKARGVQSVRAYVPEAAAKPSRANPPGVGREIAVRLITLHHLFCLLAKKLVADRLVE